MSDYDVKITGFKEIEAALLSLESSEVIDQIQRESLRTAGNVIKAALIAATPTRVTTAYGDDLPPDALKEAVRAVARLGKNGEASTETVDFGKLSYIAHMVDIGHVNPTAKNPNKLKHTPAHPFIREVEDATREEALDAYVSTMQAGINEVLK